LDATQEKGLKLEWELYPKCIQYFAQKRLKTEKIAYPLKNGRKFQRTVVRILAEKKSRKL